MKFILILPLILIPSISIAKDCVDNFNRDNVTSCYTDALAEQDKILNSSYKSLKNKLPVIEKTAFKKAQVAWLKYRDSD